MPVVELSEIARITGLDLIINNFILNVVCEADVEEVLQLLRNQDQHHFHAYALLLVKITTLIDSIPKILCSNMF